VIAIKIDTLEFSLKMLDIYSQHVSVKLTIVLKLHATAFSCNKQTRIKQN